MFSFRFKNMISLHPDQPYGLHNQAYTHDITECKGFLFMDKCIKQVNTENRTESWKDQSRQEQKEKAASRPAKHNGASTATPGSWDLGAHVRGARTRPSQATTTTTSLLIYLQMHTPFDATELDALSEKEGERLGLPRQLVSRKKLSWTCMQLQTHAKPSRTQLWKHSMSRTIILLSSEEIA